MSYERSSIQRLVPATAGRELLLAGILLAGLWGILINHLRVEWTLNPQYGYGWAVPCLCLFLIGRNKFPLAPHPALAHRGTVQAGLWFLALLFAPVRLIEEANPEWRLVSWVLALDVVGLTLGLAYLGWGATGLQRLAFPVMYFLVAVPWPTFLENPVIQGLTRADASATVELLSWLGVPAQAHGNVIEVATGEVGIDEACSGIRSFQATLMISLFLGELYHLNWPRRLGLVLGGFALSFMFNLGRMSILVWVAARQGTGAISKWHDPTGLAILLACFFSLWGVGLMLESRKSAVPATAARTNPDSLPRPPFRLAPLLTALLAWFVLVGVAVEGWYQWRTMALPPANPWTVSWPTNNPTSKNMVIPDQTRQILRFTEGRSVAWAEAGLAWQVVFLRWAPGRTALHLVQNHTPEICMSGAGNSVRTIAQRVWLAAGNLQLPFMVCQLDNAAQPTFIYYCLWDDRASQQGQDTLVLTYGNRLAPVLAGLRNPGQRSLEIMVTGNLDETGARAAVQKELGKLIKLAPAAGA